MTKALEIVLALVAVGATLAFGGVQPIAYSIVEVALFGALFLLLASQTWQGDIRLNLPIWPVLLLFVIALQLVPLPTSIVTWLSPQRVADLTPVGQASPGQDWATLSVYPYETAVALVKFLAYVCAFVLAACFFDSRRGKSRLITAMIFLVCFQAAYGMVQYLTGWQKIFTYTREFHLDRATGTFINPNHYAGLIGLTLPFVLAAAFRNFQRWADERRPRSRRAAPWTKASPGVVCLFYAFIAVLIFVALLFSRSRGGILSCLVSLVFLGLLAQLRVQRKAWAAGLFLFVFLVAVYGLWIGLGPVLARFETLAQARVLELEDRVAFWKDTLGVIRDYPVAGTGLGTFATVYRAYQTARVESLVDHAHNDYLQFGSEIGLLGAALLFLPILFLFSKMIHSFLNDTNRYRRAVTLGCIGSTLAILLHSLSDFNLQIPANAIVFSIVLGIGYKAAWIERRRENENAPAGRTVH